MSWCISLVCTMKWTGRYMIYMRKGYLIHSFFSSWFKKSLCLIWMQHIRKKYLSLENIKFLFRLYVQCKIKDTIFFLKYSIKFLCKLIIYIAIFYNFYNNKFKWLWWCDNLWIFYIKKMGSCEITNH